MHEVRKHVSCMSGTNKRVSFKSVSWMFYTFIGTTCGTKHVLLLGCCLRRQRSTASIGMPTHCIKWRAAMLRLFSCPLTSEATETHPNCGHRPQTMDWRARTLSGDVPCIISFTEAIVACVLVVVTFHCTNFLHRYRALVERSLPSDRDNAPSWCIQ